MSNKAAQTSATHALQIQSFTYEDRYGLLPTLMAALGHSGGWLLERRTLSPTQMQFRVEIQLRSVLDLYASIVGTGVELTRSGHEAFTELCTRRSHMLRHDDHCLTGNSSAHTLGHPGQVVEIRLELNFLDDITLHSLLSSGSALA